MGGTYNMYMIEEKCILIVTGTPKERHHLGDVGVDVK
jgi:hypothetical protein